MDAVANFLDEIAALTPEAALLMKNWQEDELIVKYQLQVDLTTVLVLGGISPATFAVRLLANRRFEATTSVLRDYPQTTLEEAASRSRRYQSLQQENEVLNRLFKMLVEQEVSEAAEYYAWEVHPSGQVFVRLNGENKDKRYVDYFSGRTKPIGDL